MVATGWVGEPEAAGPAPGVASFMLANRAPDQGRTIGQALARAAAAPDRPDPEPEDPDDKMSGLLMRGYSPGLVSQLSQRLADTVAELQGEQEKLERAARRSERLHREHVAGRISAFAVMRALGDSDDGDDARAAMLARRAESLRGQLREASEAITPPQRRAPDQAEAATQRAHQAFVETTRAAMAEAEARVPEPRPFGGPGVVTEPSPDDYQAAGYHDAVRASLGPAEGCQHCANLPGATAAERARIHAGAW